APPQNPSAPQRDALPGAPSAASAPRARSRRRRRESGGFFDPKQLLKALPDALHKLHPRALAKNPVLFVVAAGSLLTTLSAAFHPSVFTWMISVWLWLTVIFANLAEAVAEGRGKAQAASLRKARTDTVARRLRNWRVGMHLQHADTEVIAASEV